LVTASTHRTLCYKVLDIESVNELVVFTMRKLRTTY